MAKIILWLLVIVFLGVFPNPAWAGKVVHRVRSKIPYHPQWVTVIKKGKVFKYKRKEYSSPGVYGDYVFSGGSGGYFYAMKKKNGHKVWRFHAEGSINSTPAFWEDRVYFGDDKGNFYCLATKDGQELWRANLGAEVMTRPAIWRGNVLAVSLEGNVAAFTADEGKPLWEQNVTLGQFALAENTMTLLGTSIPLIDEPRQRVLVGSSDGGLRALSLKDGKVVWEKELGSGLFRDIDATPAIDNNRLYVATAEGPVMALSLKKGAVVWQQEVGSTAALSLSGDVLYVSGSDGILYAMQSDSGKKIWEKKIGDGALTAPVIHGQVVAVGLSDKTVNFLNKDTGEIRIRRFARKGVFSDLVLDDHGLYYLSNGGRLYSLKMVD